MMPCRKIAWCGASARPMQVVGKSGSSGRPSLGKASEIEAGGLSAGGGRLGKPFTTQMTSAVSASGSTKMSRSSLEPRPSMASGDREVVHRARHLREVPHLVLDVDERHHLGLLARLDVADERVRGVQDLE